MPEIKLKNIDIRGRKILIIHPDADRAERHEASFEQDPALLGVDVYTATTIEDARALARKHGIDLAIFPQTVGDRDFVAIQQELRHAHSSIELIPLIGMPTIEQLRESRRAGGVADFAEATTLNSYEELRALVLGYLRDRKAQDRGASGQMLDQCAGLQRALLTEHANWQEIKALSGRLVGPIAANYDLGPTEAAATIAAESVFMPWLSKSQYLPLLGADTHHLAPLLAATGNWGSELRRPTSIAGFVITLANYIAEQVRTGASAETIAQAITSRPEHLMHPALRTMNPTALAKILDRAFEGTLGQQEAGVV